MPKKNTVEPPNDSNFQGKRDNRNLWPHVPYVNLNNFLWSYDRLALLTLLFVGFGCVLLSCV